VGVDAAQGDWITFLDDDDVLLPGHVSGLVAAQRSAGGARFVYTLARARMADGRTQAWGQPFALAELYERNFIHLATALFSRDLLTLGCRFDETLEIMQDWDFFLQCAQHTPFHFEPRQTFEWHAERGTSGAAGGANQDDVRFSAFRERIYAKWADRSEALVDRVRAGVQETVDRLRNGDPAGAEARCREMLAYSQNDPHALNVLALVLRSTGRARAARDAQELACAVRPGDASLLYNLALACRVQGDLDAARASCRRAIEAAPEFAPARKLLAELGT
jgi:tetratricopeptide (TPR) repeat protein